MSEPRCVKCILNDNIQKTVLINRTKTCIECKHGTKTAKCTDCGKTMVFCNIVNYWHDGIEKHKCVKFEPK